MITLCICAVWVYVCVLVCVRGCPHLSVCGCVPVLVAFASLSFSVCVCA